MIVIKYVPFKFIPFFHPIVAPIFEICLRLQSRKIVPFRKDVFLQIWNSRIFSWNRLGHKRKTWNYRTKNTSSDESSAEHPMNVVHFKTRKNATSVDYCEKYSLNAESILRFRLLCTLIADTEFEFQLVLMANMSFKINKSDFQ